MRVIDVLRTYHSVDQWVMFVDMDAVGTKDHNKIWSKPMKMKNITWDRLRHIENKYVVSVNYSPKSGYLIIRHRSEKSIFDK